MPSLGFLIYGDDFYGISPMQGIHALLTLQLLGLFMVRHRRIMLVSSAGYLPGMKGRLDWIL